VFAGLVAFGSLRRNVRRIPSMSHRFSSASSTLSALAAAAVLAALLPSTARAAPPARPKAQASAASAAPKTAATREAWHRSLLQLPKPAEGCYNATFPRIEWKAVACGAAPNYPMLPSRGGSSHFIVGGGVNDFAANPAGTISAVEGAFPSITAGSPKAGQSRTRVRQ
jgi:hypothetical protein